MFDTIVVIVSDSKGPLGFIFLRTPNNVLMYLRRKFRMERDIIAKFWFQFQISFCFFQQDAQCTDHSERISNSNEYTE